MRARAALCALALSPGACLWDTSMGEVDGPDAGPASGERLARLAQFAAGLVGSYQGNAGPEDVTITQTFRADGGFVGTCDAGESLLLAGFCQGIDGEGSYQLTSLEASGSAEALLTVGDAPATQLLGLRLSADGDTLTYLAISASDSSVLNGLRDAGVSISGGSRTFVSLQRRR
jgi:hypothetical protein